MNHCEDCGELVCSCDVVLEEESQKDQGKPFVWEHAFESVTEQGTTQFKTVLPDYDD